MTITLALEHLYASTQAYFVANQINAVNVFGLREVARHPDTLPKITWVPGDPGGSLGELGGARNPGNYPRSIADLKELFTVHIYAFDPRAVEDERAQYHVTRMLYETWLVAMYGAAHGTFRVRSQSWVRGKSAARSFGATLRAVCEVSAPIVEALPDEPLVGEGYAGRVDGIEIAATADLTMELNDEVDDT